MLQSTSLLVPQQPQPQPSSPTPNRPYRASQYGTIVNINATRSSYQSTNSDTWRAALKPPRTPTPSTVSPNDDDDGLYLLWTHQLLKERRGTMDADADDHSSTDSSVTNGDFGDGDDGTTSRPWTLSYSYSSSTSVYKPSIHMSTSSYSHQLNSTNSPAIGTHDEEDQVPIFSGWWKSCFLCNSKQ